MIRIALLLLLFGTGVGVAADPTPMDPQGLSSGFFGGIIDLIGGPIFSLVLAIGIIATIWAIARGSKTAAWYLLAGFIFFAFAQGLISMLGNTGNATADIGIPVINIPADDFPSYANGDADLQIAGETASYQYSTSWMYLGAVISNAFTAAAFSIGAPFIVAAIGALMTYYAISVQQSAGSIVRYLLTTIVVFVFCVYPVVRFESPSDSVLDQSAVIASANQINDAGMGDAAIAASRTIVPVMPALSMIAANEISEALGRFVSNATPSSYATSVVMSARTARLTEDQRRGIGEYRAACSAGARGVRGLTDPSQNGNVVNFKKLSHAVMNVAPGLAGRNPLTAWGDTAYLGVPIESFIGNDEREHNPSAYDLQGLTLSSSWTPWQYTYPGALYEPGGSGNAMFRPEKYVRWGATRVRLTGTEKVGRFSPHFYPIEYPAAASAPRFTAIYRKRGAIQDILDNGKTLSDIIINGREFVIPYCVSPDSGLTMKISDGTVLNGPFSIGGNLGSQGITQLDMRDHPYMQWLASKSIGYKHKITVHAENYSDWVRERLIGRYTTNRCRSISGQPSNSDYFGCLITGKFNALPDGTGDVSKEITKAISDASSGSSLITDVGAMVVENINTQPLTRDYAGLASTLNGGSPLDPANRPQLRAAVDVIMSAAGIMQQNGYASGVRFTGDIGDDGAELPAAAEPGFWGFLTALPDLGLWILGTFASILATVFLYLWPHVVGIAMMVLLIVFPVFGILAMMPGKWPVLLDWFRAAVWISLWPAFGTLGFALINVGSGSGGVLNLAANTPLPGESVLKILGCAMIMMTPVITRAIVVPSFEGLAGLGMSVFGTTFKVLGVATQLAVLAGGAGAGAILAGAGAGGGAIAAARDKRKDPAGEPPAPGSPGSVPAGQTKQPSKVAKGAQLGWRMGVGTGQAGSMTVTAAGELGQAMGGPDSSGRAGVYAARAFGEGAEKVGRVGGRIAGGTAAAGLSKAAQVTGSRNRMLGRIATDLGGGNAKVEARIADGGLAGAQRELTKLQSSGAAPDRIDAVRGQVASFASQKSAALQTQGKSAEAAEAALLAADATMGRIDAGTLPPEDGAMAVDGALAAATTAEKRALANGNQSDLAKARSYKTQAATMASRARFRSANDRAKQAEQLASTIDGSQNPIDERVRQRQVDDLYREAGQLRSEGTRLARTAFSGAESDVQSVKSLPVESVRDLGTVATTAGVVMAAQQAAQESGGLVDSTRLTGGMREALTGVEQRANRIPGAAEVTRAISAIHAGGTGSHQRAAQQLRMASQTVDDGAMQTRLSRLAADIEQRGPTAGATAQLHAISTALSGKGTSTTRLDLSDAGTDDDEVIIIEKDK